MNIYLHTLVEQPFSNVVSGFDRDLFQALKPPLMELNLKQFDGCKKGDTVHLEMGIGIIRQEWISLITYDNLTESQFKFIDKGTLLPPPLKEWTHQHIVNALEDGSSEIIDNIDYSTGKKWLNILIYPAMYILFWLRKPVYRKYFQEK